MTLQDYKNQECTGCGKTSDQIADEEGWTDDDFDSCSVTTDSGHWYCHSDCYRDRK